MSPLVSLCLYPAVRIEGDKEMTKRTWLAFYVLFCHHNALQNDDNDDDDQLSFPGPLKIFVFFKNVGLVKRRSVCMSSALLEFPGFFPSTKHTNGYIETTNCNFASL